MTDAELLGRYVREKSDPAFAELVGRHVALVYSVARRHVDPAQAEDVAQSVFIELARRAHAIEPGTPLVAWLHVVARRIALNTARAGARRLAREQRAAVHLAAMPTDPSPPIWPAIEPLLDEAVESLPPPDRAAILLRFFEGKSLRDVGVALGTSDDTAQKRVSRALEQLRSFFLRRGVTTSVTALASSLPAHAAQMAPAGLAISITAHMAALSSSAGAAASLTQALTMTSLQKPLLAGVLTFVVGAGLYEANGLRTQAAAIQATQEQTASTHAAIRELNAARAVTADRLASVEKQIDARLAAATAVRNTADDALESQAREWLAQIDRLKEALVQRPAHNIPELQLLNEHHWFSVASGGRLDSEDAIRRSLSGLRRQAEGIATGRLFKALTAYITAHDGLLPTRPDELAAYCDPPLDPAVFERYEMLHSGKAADVPRGRTTRVLAPKQPPDPELDSYVGVGPGGYGNTSALSYNYGEAQRRFAAANNGNRAVTATQLLPFLKWPVSPEALQKMMTPQASPLAR